MLYVASGDVRGFADAVERLLDDPDLRTAMGMRARRRVVDELDWRPQSVAYVGVYDELTGSASNRSEVHVQDALDEKVWADALGRSYVDVDDPDELARFIVNRTRTAPLAIGGPRRAMTPAE